MAMRYPNVALGFVATGAPNATTFDINAANTRVAFSFIAPASTVKLTQAMLRLGTMSGTVAASELKAELQTDSAGSPDNTPLETVDCNTTPASNTTATWTFNTTLTAGTRYWIVIKNTNATPATNHITINFGNAASNSERGQDATIGWAKRQTADASTWATSAVVGTTGLRVGYDDGTYEGFPFYSQGTTAVGDGIYNTRELGNLFTTPLYVNLYVHGVTIFFGAKTGTPTGTPRIRLYTGTSPALLATGSTLYTTSPTSSMYDFFFSTPQVLPANTVCRVTVGETTQSDASGNRYNLRAYTVFDDNQSRQLLPFNGTMLKTYFDGSSWTDSTVEMIPMQLFINSYQTSFAPIHIHMPSA